MYITNRLWLCILKGLTQYERNLVQNALIPDECNETGIMLEDSDFSESLTKKIRELTMQCLKKN